jgi:hypothetical protein
MGKGASEVEAEGEAEAGAEVEEHRIWRRSRGRCHCSVATRCCHVGLPSAVTRVDLNAILSMAAGGVVAGAKKMQKEERL